MRWSIVSTGRGYGSGTFGAARIEALTAIVVPGQCVWDIGAHKGFMTLAASQLVGPAGTVVSAEPSSRNRWFIDRHLAWNAIENVEVVGTALSGRRGSAPFGGTGDSLAYRLGRGDEVVPVRTIPGVMAEWRLPRPDVIKIDAEGEEASILEGAGGALADGAGVLISVHGREMHARCTAHLRERGFRIFESREMARCSADCRVPWTSDYDLLAVGPERDVDDERIRSLELFAGP